MKKSILKKLILVIVVLLIVIQFFGTKKNISNEVSQNAIDKHYGVPANIQEVLKTSCYDCHSNNTDYPWYSNVQPVKWWLEGHVNEGKEELNFDEFNTYSIKKKLHKLDEVIETVRKNEMPLKSYTIIHRNAKLSESEKLELERWANDVKNQVRATQ